MSTGQQLTPGATLSLEGRIYRVESCVKVTLKGSSFIKAKLKDLADDKVIERNFKPGQAVEEVQLLEKLLEFLYPEGKNYIFLDVGNLDQISVPSDRIGEKVHFLKEGVEIRATFYGEVIFGVELPQFLELMVVKAEAVESTAAVGGSSKMAFLETGASLEVPSFIEAGDVIRVDTHHKEYIQRV